MHRVAAVDARVGHDTVEFPVGFHGLLHGIFKIGAAAGVAFDKKRARFSGDSTAVFDIDVHERDVPAFGGKLAHACRADARRAAGDENVLFALSHSSLLLTVLTVGKPSEHWVPANGNRGAESGSR